MNYKHLQRPNNDCTAVKGQNDYCNQTDPKSKPDRLKTHCLKQDKRMKKRILFVNDENSKRNICSYCISKTFCHLEYKNGGHSTIGCTRPQNNMCVKNKTSTQCTLQQSNTTHCLSFTTWTAHKWCLPSQTMTSIPGLMWRTHGTIKRCTTEMHTREYKALYKG